MNELIKSLCERKSVRAFEDREILPAEKDAILQAAVQAPTAGNQQLYTILDITDQKLKDALAETCDHQPFIAKAKLVLLFCADCQKWQDLYRAAGCAPRDPGPGTLLLAFSDALIAAQNAVSAAWSLGIGSCYIGDILENCETHRKLLNLPGLVVPAALVVFGYPTRQQKERPKPERAPMETVVHANGYHRMQEAKLRCYLKNTLKGKEFELWVQAFHARKYDSDFAREMDRSVKEYLKAFDGLD